MGWCVVLGRHKSHTPLHELMEPLANYDAGFSVRQTGFSFDGQPMDQKGISKELEMEKEDDIESSYLLVSL